MARELASLIKSNCPDSKERNISFVKLEAATMWAYIAIAKHAE